MLMLRCKNLLQRVPERSIYLAKLLALSTGLHVLFLVILLGAYHYQHPIRLTFTINHRLDSAHIKLMPLLKTVPGAITTLTEKKPVVTSTAKKVEQKKVVPQKKVESKKAVSSKTTLSNKKVASVPKPKVAEKPVLKQVEKKEVPKKVAEQKIEPKKTLPVNNTALPQSNQKPVEQPKDDVICLGRNDVALLELHNQLQEQIQKTWHPPVGLSKDLACTIKVKIDSKGSVVDCAVEESSFVISYDISARVALASMSFPKELWAKEVVITFKQ